MGRILKLLGVVGGAVLAFIVLAMIALTLFVDPNDYKTEISASGVLENGVLTNRDLKADLAFMTATGRGTVNLVTDFGLIAQFVDGPILQSDPAMAGLAGDELPLKVSGSLSSPSVLPDFSAMIRAQAE